MCGDYIIDFDDYNMMMKEMMNLHWHLKIPTGKCRRFGRFRRF